MREAGKSSWAGLCFGARRAEIQLFAALLLTLAMASVASATTYYVSVSGSDGNNGLTPGTAWRHINYAASQTAAGDTVTVLAGTYNERVMVRNSGASGAPITFQANPGDTVTLDGTGVVPDPWVEDYGMFDIEGASYITLDGLRVINSSWIGIVVRGPSSSYITISNCYTYNTASSGIAAWGRTAEGSYGISYLTLEDNEVVLACNDAVNGHNEQITVAQGVEQFVIRNNHVHDGGPGANEGGPLGIDAKYGVRYGEVYENYVHHIQRAAGIYVDSGWDGRSATNIKVYNNEIHNCEQGGISIGAEDGGATANIDVYNNVIHDNPRSGIGAHGWGQPAGTLTNVRIYNNTCAYNGDADYYNCAGIHVTHPTATGEIRNNIVVGNVMANIWLGTNAIACNPYMVVDHNLVNIPAGSNDCETVGTNAIIADPQFVDAANDNYHLLGTSPARNAATSVLAPTFDYDWVTRPQGVGYDMGAYEYPETPQPPVANFSGNPTSGALPLTVNFTDLSSGIPTSWSWTFGDGGTATAQNPSHQYISAGSYTVSLTATNALGSDSETKANYISVVVPITLLSDGFETNFDKWTDGGVTDWDRATDRKYTGSYSAHAGSADNDLISDNISATGYSSITIEFWYRDDDIDDTDNIYLQLYNGSTYANKFELGNSTEDTWHYCTITLNNSGGDVQYFVANFRIKFEGTSIDNGENLWIDDVKITALP